MVEENLVYMEGNEKENWILILLKLMIRMIKHHKMIKYSKPNKTGMIYRK